ncbi:MULTISPECIES: type II secretion system secretin GspD [unclassified Pseudomonas]|uniref:type II secretion system secretin GspD n=1 Tax=unclassified Pseudomonas TaxID=196821 RepID=UPI001294B59D|nr:MULTISPECIES: type II secretion system secretin GspD [unclassified Pseudomonas]MQT43333.1 type II secretion system protein GspD [Pseudomonas sp. FSL R10-0765]MQU01895.1 type II secretion system protein GspD [Pseudomonas sp. FSL R10-2245]MQU10313.1 type II secretion system protein GspD [Pseudomonas sp. FSL R10-2189]MQU39166.1 type II secretion system protein GspD [Pseudomonas sp. FSL R10-2172]
MTRPNVFGIGRLLLCSVVLSTALVQSEALADEPYWQLAMKDAELREIVQEMSSVLGATIVLDPRVQGRITVMSEAPLDREGVRELFYAVLDAHGFAVVDQGDRLLIIPAAEAKARAGNPDGSDQAFVTQVIELNASVAADVAGLLRPLVSTNGYVGPSASANALIITDTASNTRRIAELVRQLDGGTRHDYSVVELRHAQASDVAKVMQQSLGKKAEGPSSQVIADASANRLVILGNKPVRERLSKLAHSLDTKPTQQSENSRVIRLRHSDAKQLAEVLETVAQGMQQDTALAGATQKASTSEVMVAADEGQNALVIMADPAKVRSLESIVRQLDQPRSQVLIHAAIVEISGDIVNTLGVQWGVNSGSAQGGITFPGTNIQVGALAGPNPALPEGAVLQLGGDRFNALISALASDTNNNILSTPSLLTLDNQEASILVGQNVPLKSSTQNSSGNNDNPFTTFTRQDIGISLKIKPHINEGSLLRLEVEQENSELAPSLQGVDSTDLITNKRTLKSTILAEDGEIIVIGGLIKDSVRTQVSGVPLLRDIPYLGALFRWSRDEHTKTNLMVFVRPTIVRSKHDIREISEDRYNALRNLSQPSSKDTNSLLLPSDPHQMFDGNLQDPNTVDLRRPKAARP